MKRENGAAAAPDVAREASNKFLEPVIAAAREQYGTQIIITELLTKRGVDTTRHAVNRWLHADEARRKQPSLGVGLLLREVFNANKVRILKPWDATKRRKPRSRKRTKPHERKNEPTKDAASAQAGVAVPPS